MREPLIHSDPAQREAILNRLRQALEAQPQVVFAYVHGSFLEDRPFHDVDLAVYLEQMDEREISLLALEFASTLEKSLSLTHCPHPPLDVQVLNRAPLGFRYQVCHGRLLFSRDEELRTRWVEHTVYRYLDLKPLREHALKEAMTT
jgi:predicted nucleotidyltransferase